MTRSPLPNRRPSITREVQWKDHLVTVTIGFDRMGIPREVFANTLRGGDMQAALADACVLVSIGLQHGITPEALAHSMGRVPAFVNGKETEAPASPIGTILECIREASA